MGGSNTWRVAPRAWLREPASPTPPRRPTCPPPTPHRLPLTLTPLPHPPVAGQQGPGGGDSRRKRAVQGGGRHAVAAHPQPGASDGGPAKGRGWPLGRGRGGLGQGAWAAGVGRRAGGGRARVGVALRPRGPHDPSRPLVAPRGPSQPLALQRPVPPVRAPPSASRSVPGRAGHMGCGRSAGGPTPPCPRPPARPPCQTGRRPRGRRRHREWRPRSRPPRTSRPAPARLARRLGPRRRGSMHCSRRGRHVAQHGCRPARRRPRLRPWSLRRLEASRR